MPLQFNGRFGVRNPGDFQVELVFGQRIQVVDPVAVSGSFHEGEMAAVVGGIRPVVWGRWVVWAVQVGATTVLHLTKKYVGALRRASLARRRSTDCTKESLTKLRCRYRSFVKI